MNFAKRTFAAVMTVVMLFSCFAVGTTALAADKRQFVAMNGTTQDISAVRVDPTAEGGLAIDEESYYTFTPATTGYYKIDLTSKPIYYSSEKGKYSYTPLSAEDRRADYASIYIYGKYDPKTDATSDYVTSFSTSDFRFVKGYAQKEVGADPYSTGYNYYDAAATARLIGGKTYYIRAYSDYVSDWVDGRQVYYFGGSFSITPTDWNFSVSEREVSQQTFKVNESYWEDIYDEDGDWIGDKLVDGIHEETYSIYVPYISATYVGSAKNVTVPSSINNIPVEIVTGTVNKTITSLTLSSSVKSVSGFSDLKSLAAVNLASVEKMEDGCFSGCSALKTVYIPKTLKKIADSAFYNCSALASVTIADGVKRIGSYAFYNTALKSVIVPASVKAIGSYALGYISNFDVNTVDPYDLTDVLVSGFTIATRGSGEAKEYAAANGIACYDITNGCPHPYAKATVASTLFTKGSEKSVCPICGKTSTKALKTSAFKVKSVKASSKTITVKAAKQDNATKGYQIKVSTSKKFSKKTTKTITVKTTKALNKKISSLKAGKYYVKVRAFTTVGKKNVYSRYSAAKKVTVK